MALRGRWRPRLRFKQALWLECVQDSLVEEALGILVAVGHGYFDRIRVVVLQLDLRLV